MMPETMPQCSSITFTTGARQLVVQLAFEMMWCFAGSYFPSFTPSTSVTSSLVAGAEMMTFLTVDPRCALAFSASVKWPVDSTTICAPTELGGILFGIDLDLFPIDGNEVVAGNDVVFQVAENGVILKQMGESFGTGEVIDRDEFDFGVSEGGAKDVASDAAKTVDSNFYSHAFSLGYVELFRYKTVKLTNGRTLTPILASQVLD